MKHAAGRTTHKRQAFYELRDKDEVFAAEWAEVNIRREGRPDPPRSPLQRPLMHRLLAARDPARFGTTGRVELTGPHGGPVVTEHKQGLTLEMAIELVAQRRQAAAARASQTPLELPAARDAK